MHPYQNIPPYARWRTAVVETNAPAIDPAVGFRLKISDADKIATAGSCFAQHISRHLRENGFNYYVVENGHPMLAPETREKFGYGMFSARYGNIYTSRQLLQLMLRAYGELVPAEDVWIGPNGRFYDPYRPSVHPGGFASKEEMKADREQHLSCVRRLFETMDVFVFTLGLTETWVSKRDGSTFPVSPGVVAGEFDPSSHAFVNLTVEEVVSDLREFVDRLAAINPRARIILTVSPVPLAATAENRHVLTSTNLSKSVLRVAADAMERACPHVAYFASFEIVTGQFSRGRYYGADLRSITEDGVSHVMRSFFQNATVAGARPQEARREIRDDFLSANQKIVETLCDEDLLLNV